MRKLQVSEKFTSVDRGRAGRGSLKDFAGLAETAPPKRDSEII